MENIFNQQTELQKRINDVLNMGIQESIVLREIIRNGSTTVRDLTKYMNCPYGAIRDVQKVYRIPLCDCLEKRTKKVMRNGKETQVTERYKRFFLKKMAG